MSNIDTQSTSPANPPSQSNRFPILIAIVGAAVLLGVLWFALSNGRPGDNSASGPPPFTGPESISELKIKGQLPDGTTSWIGIDVSKQPNYPDDGHRANNLADSGRELFAQACTGCHGSEGKGDGPVPKRFDFTVSSPI